MPPNQNRSYRLLPAALADLIKIWDYTLETWSVNQAIAYEDQILDACDAIVASPEDGDDISDLREGYFLWRVSKHFIIYRHADNSTDIDIMRILHQRRDIKRHV